MSSKVSVIMPVYNGELFLKQAIDSLLAQSCQDWELIVIDDGSTDRTPQIIKQYTDKRIKVIRQANRGEAGARNTGLQHITGEYIAFLDADDIYLPNALQDLSSYLDSHPQYAVVFSDGFICDQEDKQLMRLTEVRPGIYTGNILNPLVMSPSVITVPVCTMTRISKVREHNLNFDEENNLIGTDWDFWIRLAVHVQFGYLDKLTCKYRIHITRTTGSEKRQRDQIYRRIKIMQSEWFHELASSTKEWFFLDLLINIFSGDREKQQQILQSDQFAEIHSSKRADLWRMVGIDALKTGCDSAQVKYYLQESLKLDSDNYKTLIFLWCLSIRRSAALALVNLWQFLLQMRRKAASIGDSRQDHLQELLGLK
jgi:glycosyltransferase involved in cell wall biosynthesis